MPGNKIGDDGAIAFAKILPKSQLTSLDISGNNIGDDGAIALSDAFLNSKLSTELNLDLSNNKIGLEGIKALQRVVGKSVIIRAWDNQGLFEQMRNLTSRYQRDNNSYTKADNSFMRSSSPSKPKEEIPEQEDKLSPEQVKSLKELLKAQEEGRSLVALTPEQEQLLQMASKDKQKGSSTQLSEKESTALKALSEQVSHGGSLVTREDMKALRLCLDGETKEQIVSGRQAIEADESKGLLYQLLQRQLNSILRATQQANITNASSTDLTGTNLRQKMLRVATGLSEVSIPAYAASATAEFIYGESRETIFKEKCSRLSHLLGDGGRDIELLSEAVARRIFLDDELLEACGKKISEDQEVKSGKKGFTKSLFAKAKPKTMSDRVASNKLGNIPDEILTMSVLLLDIIFRNKKLDSVQKINAELADDLHNQLRNNFGITVEKGSSLSKVVDQASSAKQTKPEAQPNADFLAAIAKKGAKFQKGEKEFKAMGTSLDQEVAHGVVVRKGGNDDSHLVTDEQRKKMREHSEGLKKAVLAREDKKQKMVIRAQKQGQSLAKHHDKKETQNNRDYFDNLFYLELSTLFLRCKIKQEKLLEEESEFYGLALKDLFESEEIQKIDEYLTPVISGKIGLDGFLSKIKRLSDKVSSLYQDQLNQLDLPSIKALSKVMVLNMIDCIIAKYSAMEHLDEMDMVEVGVGKKLLSRLYREKSIPSEIEDMLNLVKDTRLALDTGEIYGREKENAGKYGVKRGKRSEYSPLRLDALDLKLVDMQERGASSEKEASEEKDVAFEFETKSQDKNQDPANTGRLLARLNALEAERKAKEEQDKLERQQLLETVKLLQEQVAASPSASPKPANNQEGELVKGQSGKGGCCNIS